MPIPTLITDLSTTAASNSPAGSDSPVDGDNFLRALSAFIASLQTGTGNGVTAITSPGFIPNSATIPTNGLYLSAANTPALASNTTIRWSVNSTGNHTIAAPSSGQALAVLGVSSGSTASFGDAAANGGFVSLRRSTTTDYGYIGNSAALLSGTNTDVAIRSEGAFLLATNGATTRLVVNTAGSFAISAPSAGQGLSVLGVSSGSTASFGDAAANGGFVSFRRSTSTDYGFVGNSAAILSGTNTDMAIRAEANFLLATNGATTRLVVNTAGNFTISAPSSGTALTATAVAGALAASFASGPTKIQATTVASLLAAATAGAGAIAFVTDATATTFASVVAGGGANGVPVYSDGSVWRIG